MNYIAEINSFYNWVMLNPIDTDAQALWHALMQMNNRSAVKINEQWFWKVEFTVPNLTLLSILGFSRQQLDRMRNVLMQRGRIVYKKGRGNQTGTYSMIPFDSSLEKLKLGKEEYWLVSHNVTQSDTQEFVSHNVTQLDTQYDTQFDTQTDTQSGHKSELLHYNINNNINNNINYNAASAEGAQANELKEVLSAYENLIGPVTPRVAEIIDSYALPLELKLHAIERAHDASARNIGYIEAILRGYVTDSVKSIADAQRREAEFRSRKKQGGQGSSSQNGVLDEQVLLEMRKRMEEQQEGGV